MNYDGELRLLCETFQKCRIPVSFIEANDSIDTILDDSFKLLFGHTTALLADSLFDRIGERIIYRMSSPMRLSYLFLRLPHTVRQSVLVIGPYLSEHLEQRQIFEIGEKYNIPPHQLRLLESYYGSKPLLSENSHLLVMLDTFGECIWGSSAYSVLEINESFLLESEQLPTVRQQDADEVLLKMKLMEQRYAAENELLRAVSLGQIQKGVSLMASIASMPFEKRLDDPLRNLKNYSIIMNTLLRKTAEQSGVHPIYLDEISSGFAIRIEQLSTVRSVQKLMTQMYRSYCLLVRKHTMKKYSPPVQKALLMISADLSADLSLRNLAAAQNINPSYLSDLFRRETGKTVTDHINSERMRLAASLLDSTGLQIQTIAQHCGIMDVQYFSKLFKKYLGKTPKEYRLRSTPPHP